MSRPSAPLSEFSYHHQPGHPDKSTRVTAALLTGLLYGLLALVAWLSLTHVSRSDKLSEITATLLPDMPVRRADPVPPVLAHMIKPHFESPAMPVFTIASGAPPQAPAPLAASAARTSPMLGGTAGNGPMGQAASGNGSGGNGGAAAGCLDPTWMRAVTERVRQFFYYPDAALAVRRTGVALVHFSVGRDGRIERLRISKSAGDADLDKAALDILRKAQPLPPIPERMHTDRVDGDLPVNFGVRSFNGGGTAGNCS